MLNSNLCCITSIFQKLFLAQSHVLCNRSCWFQSFMTSFCWHLLVLALHSQSIDRVQFQSVLPVSWIINIPSSASHLLLLCTATCGIKITLLPPMSPPLYPPIPSSCSPPCTPIHPPCPISHSFSCLSVPPVFLSGCTQPWPKPYTMQTAVHTYHQKKKKNYNIYIYILFPVVWTAVHKCKANHGTTHLEIK